MGDVKVRDVSEAAFEREVLQASYHRPVVVDFWAPWCGPCRQLSPLLERVAGRYAGDVEVVKVNVDEAPGLARTYRIQGIPAVFAFRDGQVADQFVGLQPEAVVDRIFASLVPSRAERLVEQAQQADGPERERLLRLAVEESPGEAKAIVPLAQLLADRGEVDEASRLLDRVPTDPEAQRLAAQLRLAAVRLPDEELGELRRRADEGDRQAALSAGRALAGQGAYEDALAVLLPAVSDPQTRDEARNAMLEIFAVLGDGDELVARWRPKLAAALF